ncbi:hypothetical protein OAI08_05860 [Gammaproteobacteria bacterium]|nr:hypothetical protein [Gammaproteobacteria bacterium]
MTGTQLLNLALNHNLNVTTLSHLKLLSNKHNVSFREVQEAGKSLQVCVIKKSFETFIGRNGCDSKLKLFSDASENSRAVELAKVEQDLIYQEPFNDPINI